MRHVDEASDSSLRRCSIRCAAAFSKESDHDLQIRASVLISAMAIAIALTSFDLRPAAAASDGVTVQRLTEVGAARRWRRGGPAVPLAAFAALAGAMVSIAAAAHRRDADYGPYYGPHVYDPQYGRPAYR